MARVRWLFGMVALSFACNDDAVLPPSRPSPAPLDPRPPPYELGTCREHPDLGWCQVKTSALDPRQAGAELVRAAALDVLAFHCAECHSSLAPEQARWAPAAIDDLGALVRAGYIVPLDSAASPLLQIGASGEMPPPGRDPLIQADLDILSLFIDTPSFWPDSAAPGCAVAASVDFDAQLQQVANDVATLPAAEQQYYRYLSLANHAAGGCDPSALERDRQALSKGLNMLSRAPSVHAPSPVDAERLLYRIDLRDFDWVRRVDLSGVSYRDAWEAVAAQSPYSVERSGSAAALAKAATSTAFPVLFSDHLLDSALSGKLYYALIGLQRDRPSDIVYDEFGVDMAEELELGGTRRAVTTHSRLTRADRGVGRFEFGTGGVLWQSYDRVSAGASIFDEAVNVWLGAQYIFTLPNGLLGFFSTDLADGLLSDGPLTFDMLDGPLPSSTPVSCSACHASGLVPVRDELRSVALANAREIGLGARQAAVLDASYPEPAAFLDLVEHDSDTFYRRALRELQLPTSGSDPVAAAALRFGAPLGPQQAAAELGVPADVLLANLPRLAPALAPLAAGSVDRDAFAAVYLPSLCVLSESLANPPPACAGSRR